MELDAQNKPDVDFAEADLLRIIDIWRVEIVKTLLNDNSTLRVPIDTDELDKVEVVIAETEQNNPFGEKGSSLTVTGSGKWGSSGTPMEDQDLDSVLLEYAKIEDPCVIAIYDECLKQNFDLENKDPFYVNYESRMKEYVSANRVSLGRSLTAALRRAHSTLVNKAIRQIGD